MSNRKILPGRPPRTRVLHPETSAITEGYDPEMSVMAARSPIYPVSTYCFHNAAEAKHYFDMALGRVEAPEGGVSSSELIYARLNNPNAEMFEHLMVPIERGAKGAVSFASGMSSIATCMLALLRPGDAILHTRPVYGGTAHLMDHMLEPFGITSRGVEAGSTESMQQEAERLGDSLAIIYIETPANPTLRMTDIHAAARLAKDLGRKRKIVVIVDNTFLGPVFQSPLERGADICLYSATKYIGGHSDLVAGVIVTRDLDLLERVRTVRSFFGTICEPFSAWLLQRSMATIYTRTIKQSKNASKIVDRIKDNPKIQAIHYPTLFHGDQARVYAEQCSAPGAMIAFEVKGGQKAAFRFLDALRIPKLAVSLGSVESLVTHPRTTVSSEMPPEEMDRCGITDGLIRYSTGVEYWRDLAADIEQALDRI